MKNMMIAAVLIGCMIMCGCNVGKDSSSTKGTTNTATTTTAARTFSEKTDDTPANGISDTEKNTNENESMENSSKRELQEFTTNADDIDFMIDDDSAAITGETKQAITNMTTSLDNNTGVNNGNVMHDDGLDWSPLTPVD